QGKGELALVGRERLLGRQQRLDLGGRVGSDGRRRLARGSGEREHANEESESGARFLHWRDLLLQFVRSYSVSELFLRPTTGVEERPGMGARYGGGRCRRVLNGSWPAERKRDIDFGTLSGRCAASEVVPPGSKPRAIRPAKRAVRPGVLLRGSAPRARA